MSTNPFKPPDTDSTRNPLPRVGPGSALKAVFAGMAVDIGGSLMVAFGIHVMYAMRLQAERLSESEMREAMQRMPHDALYISGMVGGLLMSLLGGYVCARVARRNEYRPGLVMTACLGLFGLILGSAANDTDMLGLLTFTSVACNLLGVKFGAERNRRDEAAADPGKDASTP